MEYLMTYGWAILVIAVVLGALFQLGVFSSSSFATRTPPGACQILKTSALISLVGQCSGTLPQYVAQFNGQSSYITIGNAANLNIGDYVSVSVWVYTRSITSPGQQAIIGQMVDNALMIDMRNSGQMLAFVNGYGVSQTSAALQPNTWYHLTYTRNGPGFTSAWYMNGAAVSAGQSSFSYFSNANKLIGARTTAGSEQFNGMIANMQIYNVSLAPDQVQTLYLKGIGGAPVMPQNTIGWWPLNGDAKDYSGNGNNGQMNYISFTDQWVGGYMTR
jgi:hypothetical protein